MSTLDLIKGWGSDHVVDAMETSEWFAIDVFSSVAGATKIAKATVAFAKEAKKNGCIIAELDDLPARLRALADIFEGK